MSNPRLEKLFYHRIDNYDHDSCAKKGAIKSMLKALRHGDSVAVVADQHAKSAEGVEVDFFGHPARTHISPALMHLKTGCPIYPLMFRRTKDFMKFEMVLKEPIDVKPTDDKAGDIKKVTQMFTDLLEDLIRETPEQWMWMHRRWLDINRNGKALDRTDAN
jgi:KDO2-lipid IV(A) lauroyltransferase